MAIKFTNNASSKLTQALTADATSMQIKAEDVSKFPVLGTGDYCLLTIVGDNGNHEIVKVTNISSAGTCTIERAQDSTTAKEWPVDNRVELRITAEYLNNTADAKVVEELINTTIPSLPDNKTISLENEKLQVKDIAIRGDSSDLASNRGLFECVNVGGFDYNNLTTQGFYSVNQTGSTNGPGFAAKVFVFRPKNSVYITQVAFSITGPRMAVRGITNTVDNWSNWVFYISTSSIGDGIKVTNNIISVPEYEGATSSAAATSGLVPPADKGEQNKFLFGDGSWRPIDLAFGVFIDGTLTDGAESITSGSINDITKRGKFLLSTSVKDLPVTEGSKFLVCYNDSSAVSNGTIGSNAHQILYNYNSSGNYQILFRGATATNTWGAWKKIDPFEYLPLAGGTMRGTITSSSNTFLKSSNWEKVAIEDESRTSTSTRTISEVLDKNGKRFYGLEVTANKKGERVLQIVGRKRDNSGWFFPFSVVEKPDGSFYATTNSPSFSSNDTTIPTTEWVNDKLANYLPLSGGKMTGNITIAGNAPRFIAQATGVTKGTTPSSNQFARLDFMANGADATTNRLGIVQVKVNTAGSIITQLVAFKNEANSVDTANLQVTVKKDGTKYAEAPTPPATATGSEITTASWVNTNAIAYRKLSSINSVKGSFWFDSHSGINTAEVPNDIKIGDWWGVQFGSSDGEDRTQFISNGPLIYKRHTDSSFESTTWSAWTKIADSDGLISPKYLPLTGGNITGNLTVSNKNVVRSVNGISADTNGNVAIDTTASTVSGVAMFANDASNRTYSGGMYDSGGVRLPNYGTWRYVSFAYESGDFKGETKDVAGGTLLGHSLYLDRVVAIRVA